ncbi:type I 3-dehydroquinate dehydratase [Listeria goaensis]|uniref:type I 3-dehydroquinate dehydratase n=1 Tax=Listeria goaensis TaxID=1649188 RepID=UPI000B589C7F|nr:type I 3-dehydroquinate dehydratase [Listeria goaensis]
MNLVTINDVVIGEGTPKICVSLMGKTIADLKREVALINEFDVDIIEWRADYFGKVHDLETVKWALREIRPLIKTKPLLFTFRTKGEGGELEMKDDFYFELNRVMVRTGEVDLLDVELFHDETAVAELVSHAHASNVKVLMSSHDFEKTPPRSEILARFARMESLQADITKIAVMPENGADALVLLDAMNTLKNEATKPFVAISMGTLGVISRLSGGFFGSAITYGSIGKASAPGQVPVQNLRLILDALEAKSSEAFTEL